MLKIFILYFLIFYNLQAKDYIFKVYAKSQLNTIEISEKEKFSSYNSEGLWDDSEGDYGNESCAGYIKQFEDEVNLEVFCKTINQDGEIFWNSRIRKSVKGAGAGKLTFLNGTGKYKKFIGLSCPYGILYRNNNAWLKAKCKQ